MTLAEAAHRLELSPDAVRLRIETGKLKARNVGIGKNKLYRISEAALAEYEAKCEVKPTRVPDTEPVKRRRRRRTRISVYVGPQYV